MEHKLNIRYIYHSSFSLEFEDKIIIFDYFQGTLPKNVNDKKVIFVVTHSHADHYNESIFDYENASDITYIVSEDVYEGFLITIRKTMLCFWDKIISKN